MNIIEVLEELGVDFKRSGETPHVTHGWCGIKCPFCSDGTGNYGMGFPVDGFAATCWKCGPHPVVQTLCRVATDKFTIEQIQELIGPISQRVRAERKTGKLKIPHGVGPMGTAHKAYLFDRGLNAHAIEKLWRVQGIGATGGRLAWRLFVPVHSRGEVVSWLTRSIGKGANRYSVAPPSDESVHHKDLLYGADHARNSVVVVEGVTDVWAVGCGAACTFGTGYTAKQIARIASFPKRTICFDSDSEAQRRARALGRILEIYPGSTNVVTLESGKDPGEASGKEIIELRRRFLR